MLKYKEVTGKVTGEDRDKIINNNFFPVELTGYDAWYLYKYKLLALYKKGDASMNIVTEGPLLEAGNILYPIEKPKTKKELMELMYGGEFIKSLHPKAKYTIGIDLDEEYRKIK